LGGRRVKRRSSALATAIGAVVALVVSLVAWGPAPKAEAITGADFQAGYIISDEVFFNSGSMNESQVQQFLNSKVPNCVGGNGYPCLKDYRMSTYSRSAGEAGHCTAYAGAADEPAARIIVKVAQACRINPQVLLVMLQKEQSLIGSTSPTARQYQAAMGYGCPDTAPCDAEFYGFYNQLYKAAWQLRQYTNYPARTYRIGNVSIGYHPNAGCGSSVVNIRNQATANLYNYTPYQPNAAALANLRGTGDGCSAYGNRNFWVFFNDWFGSPTGPIAMGSVDSASVVRTAGEASIVVSGWTFDRAGPSASIDVRFTVDRPGGTTTQTVKADASRPDVASVYPAAGDRHGFSVRLPVTASGAHRVCVQPLTASGALTLGCFDFDVKPAQVLASLDSASAKRLPSGGAIAVGGWAFDSAAPTATSDVHVYVNGSGTAIQANVTRTDVGAAYPGAGSQHGFSAAIPVPSAGSYQVCVYAIALAPFASSNLFLGCRTVVVSAEDATPMANLAGSASVSASSQNTATGQTAAKAIDGVAAGYPADSSKEWATVGGRAGSTLTLAWSSAHTVSAVVLHDRPNTGDRVTGGTLTFSDGSVVNVPALDDAGGATTVTFTARATTSIRFTVTAVSASTVNVGLAEFLAFGQAAAPPTTNLAGSAQASASSQNTATGQTAAKAIDGVAAGYPGDSSKEWATAGGRAGSTLTLTWSSAQTVGSVVLFDRPNLSDRITGATLTFSDGSTVTVPALDDGGAATKVAFPARATTSIRLTVTSVSGSTTNVGLAEFQVFAS